MKRVSRLVLALLMAGAFCAFGSSALAAADSRARQSATSSSGESREIVLPVPVSELKLDDTEGRRSVTGQVVTELEFGVSSWVPEEFSRPTFSGESRVFERGSYPHVSANRLAPFVARGGPHSWYWRLGGSLLNLRRTVSLRQTVGSRDVSQSLTLASVRLGVEYAPQRFSSSLLRPFIGVALVPTMALAARSQLEERVSSGGAPLETNVGFVVRPSYLRGEFLGLRNGSIGVSAHSIFGDVDGSSMSGLGVQGLMRVEL